MTSPVRPADTRAPRNTEPRRRGKVGRFLLTITPAVLVLAVGAWVGFVNPGYLRGPMLDESMVQTQVQSVLTNDYGLPNVTGVTCPPRQLIKPGLAFDCTAKLGTAPALVHVVIQDSGGTYLVERPVLKP